MIQVRAIRTPIGASPAPVLVGIAASFVAAVGLARSIGPALLIDADASWAAARLVLGLAVAAAAVATGCPAAAGFLAWSRTRSAGRPLEGLALRKSTLAAVALASFVAGGALRFAGLDRVPVPLWIDDVSLVEATVQLQGRWSDFADSIRPAPFGVAKPFGTVGVLYLEARRLAFELVGVSVLGVRLPGAVAGCASLVTAWLLGRQLLPSGGGTLALLALAGMRWHLILSRWGWVAIFLTPIADLAALLLLRARRSGRWATAAGAGLVAGIGAHVYLSAWVAAAALGLLALWPSAERTQAQRLRLAASFSVGFLIAAAPLFLLRENRAAPYFARLSDHSLVLELRRARSPMPLLAAAEEALLSPWFVPDPVPINDLPGRSRLGWLLGVPVALGLALAVRRPREDVSAFLLAHAAAALAASVTAGQAHAPNGFRFGYLTTVTAVAAAAGCLWIAGLASRAHRRAASLAVVGLLAVQGALGARDAIVVWGESRLTFDYFHGPDTLIGRSASRWQGCGRVETDVSLVHSPITFGAVHRFHLDPWARAETRVRLPEGRERAFRISRSGDLPGPGERLVERIADAWGREWGVVIAGR